MSCLLSYVVLQDVIGAMFSEKFVEELLRPQPMYSHASVRQIFERLAHASIMKLNTSSMDKLYDLMCMGVKHQTVCCTAPNELLQVTLNHLDNILLMVPQQATAHQLASHARSLLLARYSSYSVGQYATVRQELASFFQDRRVKVSLFLQDGVQHSEGTFVMSHTGRLPAGADSPGLVRYFDERGVCFAEERLELANGPGVLPPVLQFDVLAPAERPCQLGQNMYARERIKPAPAGAHPPSAASSSSHATHPAGAGASVSTADHKASKQAARAELSLLANLVGTVKAPESEQFTVFNLFPDTAFETRYAFFPPLQRAPRLSRFQNAHPLSRLIPFFNAQRGKGRGRCRRGDYRRTPHRTEGARQLGQGIRRRGTGEARGGVLSRRFRPSRPHGQGMMPFLSARCH